LIYKYDFIRSSADAIVNPIGEPPFLEHPQDLDTFDGGIGRLHGLKSQHRFDDVLNSGMLALKSVVEVLDLPMFGGLRQLAAPFQIFDCSATGWVLIGVDDAQIFGVTQPMQRLMVNRYSALRHYFLQFTMANTIFAVPADAPQDRCARKVTQFESPSRRHCDLHALPMVTVNLLSSTSYLQQCPPQSVVGQHENHVTKKNSVIPTPAFARTGSSRHPSPAV
jgi:hypothetical protein